MKTKKKTRCEQKAKEIKEAIRRVRAGSKRDPLEVVRKDWAVQAVKASHAEGLPTIKILAERKIKMVELDLDIPDEIGNQMYEYGRKHILLDRTHVINWVFNLAIKNAVNDFKKGK